MLRTAVLLEVTFHSVANRGGVPRDFFATWPNHGTNNRKTRFGELDLMFLCVTDVPLASFLICFCATECSFV